MKFLICPYCGKKLPPENNKSCCGEIGHGEELSRKVALSDKHGVVVAYTTPPHMVNNKECV